MVWVTMVHFYIRTKNIQTRNNDLQITQNVVLDRDRTRNTQYSIQWGDHLYYCVICAIMIKYPKGVNIKKEYTQFTICKIQFTAPILAYNLD